MHGTYLLGQMGLYSLNNPLARCSMKLKSDSRISIRGDRGDIRVSAWSNDFEVFYGIYD